MLKRIYLRKIYLSLAALFAAFLIYFIPSNKPKLEVKTKLEYVDSKVENAPIFLMDKNSYVALTNAPVSEKDIEKKARELIKILTIGAMESKVPSGFSAILPPDTEVLNLNYEKEILKINFSKDILNVDKNLEEKMIEAIVYTLTSIEKVNKIIIYVEGDILTKLPKSKINLPSTLDRTFGINKEFDLTNTKNITDVTVYYINQINENYYYVPVTKYLNDTREKINIIVEQLSTEFNPNKKLMSFVNNDVKLVSSILDGKDMKLELDKIGEDGDLTNLINNMISLSACDNYDINSVTLNTSQKKCKNAETK